MLSPAHGKVRESRPELRKCVDSGSEGMGGGGGRETLLVLSGALLLDVVKTDLRSTNYISFPTPVLICKAVIEPRADMIGCAQAPGCISTHAPFRTR
jgi:hypothetical protein